MGVDMGFWAFEEKGSSWVQKDGLLASIRMNILNELLNEHWENVPKMIRKEIKEPFKFYQQEHDIWSDLLEPVQIKKEMELLIKFIEDHPDITAGEEFLDGEEVKPALTYSEGYDTYKISLNPEIIKHSVDGAAFVEKEGPKKAKKLLLKTFSAIKKNLKEMEKALGPLKTANIQDIPLIKKEIKQMDDETLAKWLDKYYDLVIKPRKLPKAFNKKTLTVEGIIRRPKKHIMYSFIPQLQKVVTFCDTCIKKGYKIKTEVG